jgi:hypothetical protein
MDSEAFSFIYSVKVLLSACSVVNEVSKAVVSLVDKTIRELFCSAYAPYLKFSPATKKVVALSNLLHCSFTFSAVWEVKSFT